jgi:hypothetical protein
MTEALQEAIEQIQHLDPALQDLLASFIQQKLAELEADPRTQAAIARLHAEWRARLPEQLAAIQRGEHGPIYYSDEEFLASLEEQDE